MIGPGTPGPSWCFELLLGTCLALLFAVAVLAPRLHVQLHLHSHGVPTLHSKSS
jgi:hypothetical protein